MKYTGPVRFIFKGDTDLAMKYTSRSRLLLQQAMDRMGPDKAYWNRTLPDGTEITVSSLGGVKQAWITAPDSGEISPYKQGYLVLSTEEDQYYPIFDYTPYQVVNDPTEDTVAGNVEWVGHHNRVLSWSGGPSRYTSGGSGINIYYRGSIYTPAPSTIQGAAIANNHIIIATENGNLYHRPFSVNRYSDASLYDEDSNTDGWRSISTSGLPLSGMVGTSCASLDGLKWTNYYPSTAMLYDWELDYDLANDTFTVVSIKTTAADDFNHIADTKVYGHDYLEVCGTLSKSLSDNGYFYDAPIVNTSPCYQNWSTFTLGLPHIDEYSYTYNTDSFSSGYLKYLGNYSRFLGTDYKIDGGIGRIGIVSDNDFYELTNIGREYIDASSTRTGSYVESGINNIYTITSDISEEFVNVDLTIHRSDLNWVVGDLVRPAIHYDAVFEDRTIDVYTAESFNTVTLPGTFINDYPDSPAVAIATTGVDPDYTIPLSGSTIRHEETRVIAEDIRYSSAVYIKYLREGRDALVQVIWEKESDPKLNITIVDIPISIGDPPFTLKGHSDFIDVNDIFVNAGAELEESNIQIHHVDIIPDSNDLVLFIDITLYGERYTKVYSSKNAGIYISNNSIENNYSVSEIKAL